MKRWNYDDLIERLRNATALPMIQSLCNESADEIERLEAELNTCRNELCLKCGNYRETHNGACDGCRWRDMG